MSVWQTKEKKKPRKKPVAKRKPLTLPTDIQCTDAQRFVHAELVAAYPEQLTCEDILERAIRKECACIKRIKDVWDALDAQPLWNEYASKTRNNKYIAKTE